jgi:hypothetical protein
MTTAAPQAGQNRAVAPSSDSHAVQRLLIRKRRRLYGAGPGATAC